MARERDPGSFCLQTTNKQIRNYITCHMLSISTCRYEVEMSRSRLGSPLLVLVLVSAPPSLPLLLQSLSSVLSHTLSRGTIRDRAV